MRPWMIIWSISNRICSMELWPELSSLCLGEIMNIHVVKPNQTVMMPPQSPLWIVDTNYVVEPICSCRSVIDQSDATSRAVCPFIWKSRNNCHFMISCYSWRPFTVLNINIIVFDRVEQVFGWNKCPVRIMFFLRVSVKCVNKSKRKNN